MPFQILLQRRNIKMDPELLQIIEMLKALPWYITVLKLWWIWFVPACLLVVWFLERPTKSQRRGLI